MRDGSETRERIERAALRLFVRGGVAETSIRDIAVEAEVSQSAMYNHYRSKDELTWHLFAVGFSEIGSELWRIGQADTPVANRFHSLINYDFQLFDNDWETVPYGFLARHLHLNQLNRVQGNPYIAVRAVIAREMRRGRIQHRDVDVAASLVVGAIIQVIDIRILGYIKGPLTNRTNQVTEACIGLLQG